MKVSSKEHKDSRLERIAKAVRVALNENNDDSDAIALAVIDAYPDPPSKKEKDNRTIIPSPNDSIVLCMLRSEAVALATALDSLPDQYARTKKLATALREQKVV